MLTIFEEGRFEIPELVRLKKVVSTVNIRTAYTEDKTEPIHDGQVTCTTFPLVFLTSNGERDFPPPFLRRCLRLTMKEPDKNQLVKIIKAHLGLETEEQNEKNGELKLKDPDYDKLVDEFIKDRKSKTLANDQLLNALFMVTKDRSLITEDKSKLIEKILQDLGQVDGDESEEDDS